MFTQCIIQITVQYPTMFTEVLSCDIESTELAIEGAVSPLLMELFGGAIIVDDVTVQQSQSNFEHVDEFSYRV